MMEKFSITIEDAATLAEFISERSLTEAVVARTKRLWRRGSVAMYYSAIKNARIGEELSLVESILLGVAWSLMQQESQEEKMMMMES